MKLTYAITPEDLSQGRRVYDTALAPTRWLTGIAEPLSFLALALGIYCYAVGNQALAFNLFATFGYLFSFATFGYLFSKGLLLRFVRDFLATKWGSESKGFRLETSDTGITFSAVDATPSGGFGSSQKAWPEFPGYCQTRNMFVLSAEPRFYVIPKRSLTAEEISEFHGLLSEKVPEVEVRTGSQAVGRAVSVALLGFILFFFFGGMIQGALWRMVRPFQTRGAVPSPISVRVPPPASSDQLHGSGRIYLVPIGDTSPLVSLPLLEHYRSKYGLSLHALPSIPVPEYARDEARHQLVADELVEAMRRAYPQQAAIADNILIGLTDEDMYISELDWKFALNFRMNPRQLVISTARLNSAYDGMPPAPALLETRLRKLLTKNIGLTYFGLQLAYDRRSVLYNDVEDMETLDGMREDYSLNEAKHRRNADYEDGDPCFTVRHYYSTKKQRKDSAYLTGCSSTHGETDLEVLNIYMRSGLLQSRHTDFYRPGPLPLELSRVIRTQDSRSRAFGIGGNHSLNVFPVGNTWPFTWIDLILEDGGRLHYRRSNWGASYWDAVYLAGPTISDFYSSHVTWSRPGWKLVRQDARTYVFPAGCGVERPEQAALLGFQDSSGNALRLQREPSGNLVSANSSDGGWIRFKYDAGYRIIKAQDSKGNGGSYRYSPAGCLEEVKDAEHHVTSYGHEGTRCPTSMAIDGHRVWSAKFDNRDWVTELDLADVGRYQFKYFVDDSGSATQVDIKDPGNNVLRITYDRSGYWLGHLANGNASLALR